MEAGAAEPPEPYLHSLDLLRGFAAIAVCLYHTSFMLTPGHKVLPGGFLCVDLFFLLSGFVIARTYDHRIEGGMTFGAFCVQRLARLYPLFLITTLVGFVAVNAIIRTVRTFGGGRELLTLLGNLALIPNVLRPYNIGSMFPFNGATWSIFFEFYVNVLFFVCWQYLTIHRIVLIVSFSGVLLVLTGARMRSLDFGTQSADLLRTIPRVRFRFFSAFSSAGRGSDARPGGLARRTRFWVLASSWACSTCAIGCLHLWHGLRTRAPLCWCFRWFFWH